jgi:D-ribose pyranose/furanose isomerase RbsD
MSDVAAVKQPAWISHLAEIVPLFGHRNWIVVADAAYPAQSRPGIETIAVSESQPDAVTSVLAAITAALHIRPIIHLDAELDFVRETDAPGVAEYRQQIGKILSGCPVQRLPHEKIIARLDQAAHVFRVLIVKTPMTIPYTSVFFELDCGYWNADAEQRLRLAMSAGPAK